MIDVEVRRQDVPHILDAKAELLDLTARSLFDREQRPRELAELEAELLRMEDVAGAEAGVDEDQPSLRLDQQAVADQARLRVRISADQAPAVGTHGGAVQMMDAHAWSFLSGRPPCQAALVYVGRFAPSPTGQIHFGVARTALAAWLDARKAGGTFLLRIEDIDTQRTIPGAAGEILRDLEWLGLDWDGEVVHQTDRFDRYRAALDRLRSAKRIYPCACSRKEIALASAPHGPSDDGPRYPGTCRSGAIDRGRKPAIR